MTGPSNSAALRNRSTSFVIDGEAVLLGVDGVSDFNGLHSRKHDDKVEFLEDVFWSGMKEISRQRDMTLSELAREIDSNRQQGNLSSAIRLFVLDYFRTRAK
jgi:hypothetical protein